MRLVRSELIFDEVEIEGLVKILNEFSTIYICTNIPEFGNRSKKLEIIR